LNISPTTVGFGVHLVAGQMAASEGVLAQKMVDVV